jgi:hypothetical protein
MKTKTNQNIREILISLEFAAPPQITVRKQLLAAEKQHPAVPEQVLVTAKPALAARKQFLAPYKHFVETPKRL